MRRRKEKLLLMSMVMLLSGVKEVRGEGLGYIDVKEGHWAYKAIIELSEKGVVNGYEDGSFRPSKGVTRAEFVKMLVKEGGLEKKGEVEFKDVSKEHWAYESIAIAVSNGICKGVSEEEFAPNKEVTREEAAVMLSNYKGGTDKAYDKIGTYKDGDKVSSWAKDGMEYMVEQGYMKGYEDGELKPSNGVTRAETVTLLERLSKEVELPTFWVEEEQKKIAELVNQERDKAGLEPLNVDLRINEVALLKSQDMVKNEYFDHTSPTYGTPYEMLESYGIEATRSGENIAVGYESAEEVMEAWMGSESHRLNILNPRYTDIGVGVERVATGGYAWTQIFIAK